MVSSLLDMDCFGGGLTFSHHPPTHPFLLLPSFSLSACFFLPVGDLVTPARGVVRRRVD